MRCAACGHLNPAGSGFCGNCGAALGQSATPAPAAPSSSAGKTALITMCVLAIVAASALAAVVVHRQLGDSNPSTTGTLPAPPFTAGAGGLTPAPRGTAGTLPGGSQATSAAGVTTPPPAQAGSCTQPADGQISCWPAEGDTQDRISGNNGSLRGGAGFGSGKTGQAFSLPTSADFVSIGNPASLKLSAGITIDAWVNPTQAPPAGCSGDNLASIVTKWAQNFANATAADEYGLWLCNSGLTINIFSAIHLAGGAGTNEPHLQAGAVPLNTWSHIAMTYDGASGQFAIYLNGQQVGTLSTGSDRLLPTDANVLIGHEDSSLPRPFIGRLDEIRIYKRALTAAEIQSLFASGT